MVGCPYRGKAFTAREKRARHTGLKESFRNLGGRSGKAGKEAGI